MPILVRRARVESQYKQRPQRSGQKPVQRPYVFKKREARFRDNSHHNVQRAYRRRHAEHHGTRVVVLAHNAVENLTYSVSHEKTSADQPGHRSRHVVIRHNLVDIRIERFAAQIRARVHDHTQHGQFDRRMSAIRAFLLSAVGFAPDYGSGFVFCHFFAVL